MKKFQLTYIKNILLPCLVYSGIAGIFTGILIFFFKLAVSRIVPLSEEIYAFVRQKPTFFPFLLLGTALLGGLSALILHFAPDCKGGGIPTAISLLRGLLSFNWIKSIVLLMPSALITYLGGVPLGTEGPSVQMGTAVGRGTVRIFAKKHPAWDRYIMTGGAAAGFSAATGAPLTGIFFTFEEAHQRFSPMLFMTSAVSAVTSTAVMKLLCPMAGLSPTIFRFETSDAMSLAFFPVPVAVGIICGICGALFAEIYKKVNSLINSRLLRLPFAAKTVIIFVATAVAGFFTVDCIGSGDLLIEKILEGHASWKMLIVCLCIRAILLITANNIGVTGGLFVPTLCFGAIIGGLCGKAMTSFGILPDEHYVITVIVGICAFIAAASRTPIMSIAFAIEALGGINNIIPVSLGVTFAYLTVEALGVHDLTDMVIEGKLSSANKDKISEPVDISLTVKENSFASGKEIRDILWPPGCTVLSVHKKPSTHHNSHTGISEGDILDLHFRTYDREETLRNLEAIIGQQ